jgi:hypothetical protein
MAVKSKTNIQGEGDYEAARRYEKRTDDFIAAGKVAPAARNAAPRSKQEAADMKAAEKVGKNRSKGEDSGRGMSAKKRTARK